MEEKVWPQKKSQDSKSRSLFSSSLLLLVPHCYHLLLCCVASVRFEAQHQHLDPRNAAKKLLFGPTSIIHLVFKTFREIEKCTYLRQPGHRVHLLGTHSILVESRQNEGKKVYFWMSKVTSESLMMLVTMVTARRDEAAGVGLRIRLQFLLYLSFASHSLRISSRQASSQGEGGGALLLLCRGSN